MESNILLILGFAVTTVTSANILTQLFKQYLPNIKLDLIFKIIIGVCISIGYGNGVLQLLLSIDYTKVLYPTFFRYTDLIVSGLIYTLGSNVVENFIKIIFNKAKDKLDTKKKIQDK